MNAYNVFWEDGLWKNGNWEGSYYTINPDGTVTDPYVKQILNRGMSWSGTSSCHIWSVFYKESLTQFANVSPINSGSVVHHPDSTENQPPLPPNQFGVITAGSTPPVSGAPNKILGTASWDLAGLDIIDRTGTNLSQGTYFTPVDSYNSITWEIYNGTSWSSPTGTAITPFTGLSQQFNLQSGVNKFRVKGTNPDNNQVYYTNVLTYTKTVAVYTIQSPINQVVTTNTGTSGNHTLQGIVNVTSAPVTLTLTAFAGAGGLGTANTTKGFAFVNYSDGTPVPGSPFTTALASTTGTNTTTVSVILPSSDNYSVTINAQFSSGNTTGSVQLI